MKNILSGAVAAIALVAISAPAAAQTNENHYTSIFGGITTFETTNPAVMFGADLTIALTNIGTRYRARADAPINSEPAQQEINVAFNLTGEVEKDCSFYAGNNASAQNIDFGVIGVRTGDNENVNSAFEMVGNAVANIDTLTAGCNFNNEVIITKSSASGLVNSTVSGFDSTQFQNNIPYTVNASWVGTTNQASGSAGSPQSLTVAINDLDGTKQQGAWRSRMDIDIVAPAVTNKGLVAGDYAGTTTLTLRAL